ncbi:MAG: helix-turn-helix domain-containing protein [Opitutales bacterium]
MKYSEAKDVLEKQEAAKAVMAKFESLASAHKAHGFDSRGELIKALQEIDQAEKGKGGARKAKAKGAPKAKGKARGPRSLTPETIDQIRKLKSEGTSNAQISRTMGVSPITVAKYVKAQAGKTASAKPKAPAKKRGKAKAKK